MAAKYASNSLDHFPVHPMHCLQKRAYKPANNVGCRSSAVAVALVAIALASVALAAPSEPVDSGKDFSSEAPEHQAADSVKSLLQYEVGFQSIQFSWESVPSGGYSRLQISRDGGPDYVTLPGAEHLTENAFRARLRYWDIDWTKTKFRLQVCATASAECATRSVATIRPDDARLAVRRIRSVALANSLPSLRNNSAWAMIRELLTPPRTDKAQWFVSALKDEKTAAESFGVVKRKRMAAVSADTNTVVLGLSGTLHDKTKFVYARQDGKWTKQAVIKPKQEDVEGIQEITTEYIGIQVVLSADGDTLAIGDPSWTDSPPVTYFNGSRLRYETTGAVQVYARRKGQWKRQALLHASNAGHADRFGSSISLSADGNTLAVGARGEDGSTNSASAEPGQDNDDAYNAGAVYIYTRKGDKWRQHSRVKAQEPRSYDFMGSTVTLSADGKTMAASIYFNEGMRAYYLVNNFLPEDERIPLDPRASGRVYIFTYDQDRWSQQDILRPEKETPGSNFGSSISLSADGDSLAIGAPYTHINLPAQAGLNTPESGTDFAGAAYVFSRTDGRWRQRAYLQSLIPVQDGQFGSSVSISHDGDTVIVGTTREHPDTDSVAIDLIEPDAKAPWEKSVFIY